MTTNLSDEIRTLLIKVTPERKGEVNDLIAGVTFSENKETEVIDFQAWQGMKHVRVPLRC